MKTVMNILLVVAVISLVGGIIARILVGQPLGPMAISSQAFLRFTDTCLLAVIALGILELLKK
jgi:hypothetical protein